MRVTCIFMEELFYRLPTKLRKANVFVGVCQRGGVSLVPGPFRGWGRVCQGGRVCSEG